MDIFSHLFVVQIVMFVWKDENKRKKRRGVAHFLKKTLPTNLFQVSDVTSTSKQNARGLVDPRSPIDNLKKLVSQNDSDAGDVRF